MNLREYFDKSMDYLEYIGINPNIILYDPIDVSKSIGTSIAVCYNKGVSYRMAAIITWILIEIKLRCSGGLIKDFDNPPISRVH